MQNRLRGLLLCLGSLLAISCTGSSSKSTTTPMDPPVATPSSLPAPSFSLQKTLLGPSRFDPVRAISYSGYRTGQGPGKAEPSAEQIREDLALLSRHWNVIRLYGSGPQSATVLEVIAREKLPLRVMLGAWLQAEVSNPGCPWGGIYPEAELIKNRQENSAEVDQAIQLTKTYPSLVSAISVGNEILVEWTDHLVPAASVIAYVKRIKGSVTTAVTVADNYVPWQNGHEELVELLDFITIHTYPIWENKGIDVALSYAQQNYESVRQRHPHKPIAIGETGWTTGTNGVGIPVAFANEIAQQQYFKEMSAWSQSQGVPVFFFEAFDEDWKGGPDPAEPEKHWGLFTKDRRPKIAVRELFPDRV
ncbi:MAG TPA: glycosyl hydrolase family 17 protein [Oligoflexus sp.]|uniref:glycosyl hydrolase family 17 protein n=1 Tax=Oligoflexus sp. TaxID=1971216 RepID=UPI002D3EA68C|nr:glycosyl hydrolase family 17 protein [Oligoflexus sp.]HYX33385.1 glycosyl hydrolase family 17 protein [Oligoflexus sp.]